MATTTEKRRNSKGRFIKTCQGHRGKGDEWTTTWVECEAEARYYIDGYGFFGLQGTSGRARFCLTDARRALRRYQKAGRNTYRIKRAGTHEVIS